MTEPLSEAGALPLRQHTSHQRLLTPVAVEDAPKARLDAIIVPNGRTAAYLRHVFAAARDLNAELLLLCSLRAEARLAVEAAERAGVRATAFDVRRLPVSLVPQFATDTLLRSTRFERRVDTSFKRNLGLLIADLAGWQRILFLDDDIKLPRTQDLAGAAGLLDSHTVVGLANTGMPDNSVVCHAFRDSGGNQGTFIGGGALVVGKNSFESFFPNIYNEDWFFLLDGDRLRSSAVTGRAEQAPYDPYRDPRRARGEELGDTLAEGVFGLLDNGFGLHDATMAYWHEFLADRRKFIQSAIARVNGACDIEPARKARMIAALKAAVGRNLTISPSLCVDYLRAWQKDCVTWREHLQTLRQKHGAATTGSVVAFKTLGIRAFARRAA